MSVFALVTGSLQRGAEQRTSKGGKKYVTAAMRVMAGSVGQAPIDGVENMMD